MNLQRCMIFVLVLCKRRVTDQEVGPAGQRQLGAGGGQIFLVLFRMIEQELVYKKVQNFNPTFTCFFLLIKFFSIKTV